VEWPTSRPRRNGNRRVRRVPGHGQGTTWGDSTEWQYWVIDTVKRHEVARGYDVHPIGMTCSFRGGADQGERPAAGQPREWISPATTMRSLPTAATRCARLLCLALVRRSADRDAPRWSSATPTTTHRQATPVGVEVVPARPPPILMDFGLIAGLEPPVSHPPTPVCRVRVLRARAVGDGRYPPVRGAHRTDRHAARRTPRPPAIAGEPGSEYLVLEPDAKAGRSPSTCWPAPTRSSGSTSQPRNDVSEALTVESASTVEFSSPFPPVRRSVPEPHLVLEE